MKTLNFLFILFVILDVDTTSRRILYKARKQYNMPRRPIVQFLRPTRPMVQFNMPKRPMMQLNMPNRPMILRQSETANDKMMQFMQSKMKNSSKVGKNGPIRGPGYDPNYGYEPYWKGGDWVFTTTEKPRTDRCVNVTECSQIYIAYGQICGKNRHRQLRTFDTYCQLLEQNCQNEGEGWLMIHRGHCYDEMKTFEERVVYFKTNADNYLAEYSRMTLTTLEGYFRTKYQPKMLHGKK